MVRRQGTREKEIRGSAGYLEEPWRATEQDLESERRFGLGSRWLIRCVHRFVIWITRHWLAMFNLAVGMVLGLAWLAPWLMLHGQASVGQLLYLAYRPLCHQLPERSFFLGGERPWYTFEQLSAALGYDAPARYVGNPQLGYKVAFCERDVAIFAGYLLMGLLFALFRRRIKPLPWQALLAATLPLAIDGTVQLFGLAESNWQRRIATGLLFGLAVTWFALPWIQRGMAEAQEIALRSWKEEDAHDGSS